MEVLAAAQRDQDASGSLASSSHASWPLQFYVSALKCFDLFVLGKLQSTHQGPAWTSPSPDGLDSFHPYPVTRAALGPRTVSGKGKDPRELCGAPAAVSTSEHWGNPGSPPRLSLLAQIPLKRKHISEVLQGQDSAWHVICIYEYLWN